MVIADIFTKKRPVIKYLTVALALISAGNAYAGALDFYYWRELERSTKPALRMDSIKTGYFTQLIDHDHPDLGTFQQRYYVDDSYANGADSPVFFYICGEASCEPRVLNGAIREHAKQYHARLVALEHRYYGVSLPRSSFSKDDLKYLTTDFALRDLAAFRNSMQFQHNWSGQWIAFGGSYPGSLSAYFRLKYPELVSGALASSAPVQAKENFEEYDEHVTKVAGNNCAANIRAANAEIEAALSNPVRLAEIKKAFGVPTLRDNQDFLFFVADIGAAAVQYGYRSEFCSLLVVAETPLIGYIDFAQYLYKVWHIEDPLSLSTQGAESENPKDYADGLGMRQWYYQSCTEYGYWQNAHHDARKSTRSSLVNADYFRNVCHRLFGIDTPANTKLINDQYYWPLQNNQGSEIYFTNGSTDPWSRLSMTVENGNDNNRLVYYTTIAGAAHCDDLRSPKTTDSDALRDARSRLSRLIGRWLTV